VRDGRCANRQKLLWMARWERARRSLLREFCGGTYTGVDSPRLAHAKAGAPTGVGARTAYRVLVPTGAWSGPAEAFGICDVRTPVESTGLQKPETRPPRRARVRGAAEYTLTWVRKAWRT